MVEIFFHKEPERIGGGITEIKYNNHRLIIDMGAELQFAPFGRSINLDTKDIGELNPQIEGVTIGNADCDGVLISHYHEDHIGLLRYVLPEVPVYMSKVCRDISLTIKNRLKNAGHIGPSDNSIACLERAHVFTLADFGRDIEIGPFAVRPLRVDHSAFDALAYLITVGGKRIFFTGDFRNHGYTGKKFFQLLNYYVGKVDVLLIEGTMLGREDKEFSEWELSKEMQEVCAKYKYVLYLGSSTNIDSLFSISNAAKYTDKKLCLDAYQKDILQIVADNSSSTFYKRDLESKDYHKNGLVIAMRMSQLGFAKKFYEKYGDESAIIYSLWEGYVERDEELKALSKLWGEKFIPLHSGGHASIDALERTLAICTDERTTIIPMHVNAVDDFRKLATKGNVVAMHKGWSLYIESNESNPSNSHYTNHKMDYPRRKGEFGYKKSL